MPFFHHKVTIAPCNIGYGYFYRGQCFAYVWAYRQFSKEWWLNLFLIADKEVQEGILYMVRRKKRK